MTGDILASVPRNRRNPEKRTESVTQMRSTSLVPLCPLSLVVLTGCVTPINHMRGSPLPPDQNADEMTYYVVRHDRDGRDLASSIAAALRDRGLETSSGRSGATPEGTDRLVTYVDNWSWDVRMFLHTLRIEVRDAATEAILAWGESAQYTWAAMGKTFSDVINRALAGLFGEPAPW